MALSNRARIILSSADGESNKAIAERLRMTQATVRSCFIERRIAGLCDDVRPGAPRTAAETRISKSSVQRYFRLFRLQPHRTEGFKLSNDPFFIEKLRDVVALYLSPHENALVLCVDEKSQYQALECAQPMLPLDYKCHSTTSSAALEYTLHPDLQFLAESGRALLRTDHR